MTIINRNHFIAEQLIREHVRCRISSHQKKVTLAENKIRKAVRKLIEVETGTDEASQFTGINVLADLLEKIIPTVQDDYKMLTTSPEQRESFRNHIIHAIKNALRPIEASTEAENLPENHIFYVDEDILLEKIKIDLTPEDTDAADAVAGEFIDIDAPKDEDDFVEIDDQNETGRNFAAVTFKAIEKQVVDAYDMLADEEDQELFYDYLITNMLLYFDKFEDELSPSLPDTTTPEYEQKKSEESSEESEPASQPVAAGEEAPATEAPATEEPAAEPEEDTGTGMPAGMDDN